MLFFLFDDGQIDEGEDEQNGQKDRPTKGGNGEAERNEERAEI